MVGPGPGVIGECHLRCPSVIDLVLHKSHLFLTGSTNPQFSHPSHIIQSFT